MSSCFKSAVKNHFDRAAPGYDDHASLQQKAVEKLFDVAKELFAHCEYGVDCGSGTGYFNQLLARQQFGLPLIQLDLAYKMCQVANQCENMATLQGDVEWLPFADCSVPCVFSSLTLQWSENLEQSLGEIHRVLQHNAPYAFNILGSETLKELAASFTKLDDAGHVNQFITKQRLIEMLAQCGFGDYELYDHSEVMFFDHVLALLHNIKGVGANVKNSSVGYVGKDYFQSLHNLYFEHYHTPQGLPATWQIFSVVGRKIA